MISYQYPNELADGPARGRAAASNPANRFERLALHVEGAHLDAARADADTTARRVDTDVLPDLSRSVINRVDSPDLGFHWTFNPYRGCEHGCIYCYARPTHEMLGFSCGLDFETKIMAKHDAPELLRDELAAPRWRGEPIVMSGVTDCYQPIESRLEITRRCLEVFAECRQPIGIVTKSRLVLRDIDLLGELAKHRAVHVAVSVTTLDNALAARIEPRAAAPPHRLWVIRRLASAGVPVMAMVAPIIPALNDREVPTILREVADAGATAASFVLLRLPHQLKGLFERWLDEHYPDRRDHVLKLMREARGGKLYDARWSHRMRGEGAYADQLARTFDVFAARFGLTRTAPPLSRDAFRRPLDSAQLQLFDARAM